ncbi:MAG: glycosyltransferase family 87 protein [Vicinamibacterales bacterium]
MLALVTLLWFWASIAASTTDGYRDFGVFYASSRCVLDGCDPYSGAVPNLNPPFTLWLLLPFTWLPLAAAHGVWVALTFACLAGSTWLTWRALRVAATPVTALVVLGLWGSAPVLHLIMQGQVSALLLLPLTWCWTRERSGRQTSVWLTPVVAWKPMLAVLAIGRAWVSWSVLLRLALMGALLFASDAWLQGPAVYRGWIEALIRADFPHRLDGSLWQVARTFDWPTAVPLVLSLALVAVSWWRMPRVSVDAAWSLGLSVSLLASPKGWIYYGCWLMPPAAGLWQTGGRLPRAFLLLASVCAVLPLDTPLRLGPLYAVAYGCVWLAGALDESRRSTVLLPRAR